MKKYSLLHRFPLLMMWFFLSVSSHAAEDIFGDEINEEPVLITIDYINLRDRSQKTIKVYYKIGQQISSEGGNAFDRITIKPGDSVESELRPGDVRLNLYRGAGQQRVLIGGLDIRFYSSRDDENLWEPRFVLATEPILIRQGGRLVPLETSVGAGGIVLEGGNLPNAEGYYPELSFTQGLGKTFVDSWQIFKKPRF